MKKTVIIGFAGTQLDAGRGSPRWEKWRPSVALTQREDLVVSRFELLYTLPHKALIDQLAADIRAVSPETEVRPVELPIADPWDFGDVYAALYDYARACTFNPEDEDYLIHITTGTHVAQICLFLMTEARYFPGVLLQSAPPKRPTSSGGPGLYELIDLDLSRYNPIARRFAVEHKDALQFLKSGIATRNARFNKLVEEIEHVAVRSKSPMLLMGPTGAGKSLLARRVFDLKKARRLVSGNFVDVNCATLHGDGAASALFGHVKGAFTGAANERAGLLRVADKGVLFLDEIGELGVDEQAMLLKAIEEKQFFPVGADREVASDFQLIAGTNRDLRAAVAAGQFREDLFARINLWTYELPSLAQRPEDIEPNLDYLLSQFSSELGQMIRFNKEARQAYLDFATSPAARWRGNFRDLSASVMRMATLAEGGRVTQDVADAEIDRLRASWQSDAATPTPTIARWVSSEKLAQIDLFDRLQLESVIQVCRQSANLSDAGRKLFAASRTARSVANDADRLRKFLARFGLDWKSVSA